MIRDRDLATGQVITVTNFVPDDRYGFGSIAFADGESWTRSDILNHAWIRGTDGSDVLGTANNPYAGSWTTIDLGKGDDHVFGDWALGNTFIYRSGDGSDTYRLWQGDLTPSVLSFSDLLASEVEFSRTTKDLLIKDLATGQTLEVTNYIS